MNAPTAPFVGISDPAQGPRSPSAVGHGVSDQFKHNADLALGDGWYLNADVKKVWMNTDVTWNNTDLGTVRADVDIDPWIISAGVGYRFNIEDLFGHRAPAPLK